MKRLLLLTVSALVFLAAGVKAGEPAAAYPGIIQAAEAGDCAAVEAMIESGADMTVTADDGSPVLLVAAQKGCLDACRMLLDKGADPNGSNSAGETPLLVAIALKHSDVAGLLFERGADIEAVTNDGTTALFLATLRGDEDMIDTVFEMLRASSEAKGRTPEEQAAFMAEYVNRAQSRGWTALMNAAYGGDAGLIRRLVELGADVNAMDNRGITALSMARRNRQPLAEKTLIELGAK